MDNIKDNAYYVNKMLTDIEFIMAHTDGISKDGLMADEVLLDSVMFRLIQISENSGRLGDDFKSRRPHIMWRAIKGMRNRIVHDYCEVDIGVVYETAVKDIPTLHKQLTESM